MDIEAVGRWEGQDFVFHEPREVNGHEARKITLPFDTWLPEGVSRDDVIHAMLNPVDHQLEPDGSESVVLRPGQAKEEGP